jgi:type II secretory pathway component PulK
VADLRSHERGYALLAVLGICFGIGGLAMMIAAAAQEAVAASHNRRALTGAGWAAAGCLAQARGTLTDAMIAVAPGGDAVRAVWSDVNRTLRAIHQPAGFHCALTAQPLGGHLDVNAADEATLAQLLRNIGMRPNQADSGAAALADWVDADDVPRPAGAERAWYQAHHRTAPSNRPFESQRELHLVRGLEGATAIDRALDVEPGPVVLNLAPAEVLELLPGFTAEAAAQVLAARARGEPLRGFRDLPGVLSPDARKAWDLGSTRLPATAVLNPAAWVITARATGGSPPVTAVTEVRVVPSDHSIAVARRRSWIE